MFKNLNESGVNKMYTHTHDFYVPHLLKLFAHSARRAILFFVLMLFTTFFVSGQEEFSCGTPDMTGAEIEQLFQEIGFDPTNSSSIVSDLRVERNLPIHLYVIHDDYGTHPDPGGVAANHFISQLPEVNSYFSDTGFNFYVCKISNINSTQYWDVEYSENISGLYDLIEEQDGYLDMETINVYIFHDQSSIGMASLPWNIDRYINLIYYAHANIIAHELGHYFGLLHTHDRNVPVLDISDGIKVKVLPDNTWNPNYPEPAPYQPFDCTTHADRICDTNVDPRINCLPDITVCEIPDYSSYDPDEGIGVPFYTYHPPVTNLMSYYSITRNEFSNQQKELMVHTLENHWNRTFLLDDIEPECDDINNDTDIYLSRNAFVEGGRVNQSSTLVFSPLEDFYLITNVEGIDEYDVPYQYSCETSTTIDGLVELEAYYTCGFGFYPVVQPGNINTYEIGQCLDCPQLDATSGVTVFDVILIREHLLGVLDLKEREQFPYNYIAADVSNNGVISTLDIITIRKLLLGIYNEFPDAPSWRTLPKYSLTDQFETFRSVFHEDPFSSVWTYEYGQTIEERGYLPQNGNPSYLDDPITLLGANPDTRREETWSFRAVKTGDVNFSNEVPNDELGNHDYNIDLITNDGVSYGDIRDWLIVPGQFNDGKLACIEKNQSFTIEVVAQTPATIEGYQMELGFDTEGFSVEGVNAGELASFTLDNFYMPDDKTIRTVWFDEEGDAQAVNEGTVLFKLYCKATKEICGFEDIENGLILQLKKDYIQTGVWANVGGKILPVDFDFGVKVVAESKKHQLNSIFPNPISGEVNIQFKLSEPATVDFLIIDAYGNQVVETNSYQEGEHTKSFNDISRLQAGTWHYQVQLGDESHSGTLMKL